MYGGGRRRSGEIEQDGRMKESVTEEREGNSPERERYCMNEKREIQEYSVCMTNLIILHGTDVIFSNALLLQLSNCLIVSFTVCDRQRLNRNHKFCCCDSNANLVKGLCSNRRQS